MWGWALAGVALGVLAVLLCERIRGPYRHPTDPIAFVFVLLMVATCLLFVAIGKDAAALPSRVLWVLTYFSGPRVLGLGSGFALGIVTAIFRDEIYRRINQVLAGIFGRQEGPSWTLLVATAIIVIVAFIVILKPNVLENVTSFKAGNFEATFAQKSSTTKEAHLERVRLEDKNTFKQWEDFFEFYIDNNSGRAIANRWFGSPAGESQRSLFRRLWVSHFYPVVISIGCLEESEALQAEKLDQNFAKLAAYWQDFLLKINTSVQMLTKNRLDDLLNRSSDLVGQIENRAREFAEDCIDNHFREAEKNPAYRLEKADPRDDTELAWGQLEIMRASLPDNGPNAPKNYAIVLFDAYLLDAVGDMLTFLYGTRTKAEFLTRIAAGYPSSDELTQPGIINLYYQLSDAKLFSDTPWPLDQMISELNRARDGSLYIISESKKKARRDPSLEANKREITEIYNENLFLIYSRTMEIYNQRRLSGERISDEHMQNWTDAFSRFNAIMYARWEAPDASFDDLPVAWLDDETASLWRSHHIQPKDDFDAHVAAALSAILRQGNGERASTSACTAATFHVMKAKELVPKIKTALKLNPAEETRAAQYILVISDLIRGSCSSL